MLEATHYALRITHYAFLDWRLPLMKLNHLHLTVPRPLETRRFLEKYFGLQGDENPYTGEPMKGGKENKSFACLFDDDGLVLILTNIGAADEVEFPADFHIGFIQES